MLTYDVQSVALEITADTAFRFIADPRNLPRWTHAFKRAEQGRAVLDTPQGVTEIGLRVHAYADAGVVDWEMTFPDGTVGQAHSRVVPDGPGRSIFTFVLKAPPVAQERIEGTLAEQRRILAGELAKLKQVLSA